jgi:hypothetical protein
MTAQILHLEKDAGVFYDKAKKNTWLQTYSGKRVSVLDPQPEEIDISDIIFSLSKQCRFNGHCSEFYSVAEHSVRGSTLASKLGYSELVQKEFLLHDATEGYVGDLIKPVKCVLPEFSDIESKFWKVISDKFGLPNVQSEEVHYLDAVMVTWEKRDLLPNSETWPRLPDISSMRLPKLEPVPWKTAQESMRDWYTHFWGDFR